MDERRHLHDRETLLFGMHATVASLLSSLFRGLLESLIVAVLFTVIVSLILGNASGAWVLFLSSLFPVFLILSFLRWRVWQHALFRLTNDRIILEFPGRLFHSPTRTIKWSQYQESYVGHPTFFDLLFRSRPLVIRFGTADGKESTFFPSLRYAHDLKHYMDKIDSAVRKGDTDAMRPFIAKPKGQRY
jgi:hypothetical protein